MTASAAPADMAPRRSFMLPAASSAVWLYTLIGGLAAMHLSMAFGRSISWDEFWFYSQVEVVARGEFIQPLQTIHTRFFAWWLPAMPGNSIDHIVIARLFMFACIAVTAIGIALAAEKFSDRHTGLIAAALYLGAGFVLQHGTAFRVDAIVAALLTTGFVIAVRSRLNAVSIIALGVIAGLAAMVTIKFVLWAPAFAGIALYRWDEEGFDWRYPMRWIAAGAIAAATFTALYTLHSIGLAQQSESAASGTLSASAGRMFGFLHSPHLDIAMKAAGGALPLVIAAALVPWRAITLKAAWTRRAAIILMWFPLLTPAFYYNAFPYFYAFILPPVAIACAFTIPLITRRYGQGIVAAAILLSAGAVWAVDARGVTAKQDALVTAVHEVFPEPVNYFDCCGMIAPFTKQNHFRTSWGIELYRTANRPLMLEAMRENTVPLLLDNNREYTSAVLGILTDSYHPDDFAALESTFVRHWGDIFIAGRDLEAGESLQWDVLVPGTYTVSSGSIIVAGTPYAAGETFVLGRSKVELSNSQNTSTRIIWGNNPPMPAGTPPEKYWTAF